MRIKQFTGVISEPESKQSIKMFIVTTTVTFLSKDRIGMCRFYEYLNHCIISGSNETLCSHGTF